MVFSSHQWSAADVKNHSSIIIKAEIEVRTVGGAVGVFGNVLCLFLVV